MVDALWLAALMGYMLAGIALIPFHGDEATQIFMSRDYAYQFIDGDLDALRFSDPPRSAQEQDLRLLNGTINKYLIGLAWHAAGFSVDDLNQQWDWGAAWSYNQANGHAPSDALLRAARWPSALLLALGAPLMFALGRLLDGRLVAYLASTYYALSPMLLINGGRAMMEGSFIAFSLLTVIAGVLFVRRATIARGLALGAAAGLALAAKHTALYTVAPIFALCILLTLKTAPRRGLIALTVGASAAALIFYALNPAWWGDPLGRAADVLERRADLLAIQVDVFGGYDDPLDRLAGFARQALIAAPQYYEVAGWEAWIGDQIAAYEASPWRGVAIGGSPVGALLLLALMIAGGLRLTRRGRAGALVLGWALATLAATLALTPLEWGRYYVPAYLPIGLLAALGASAALRRLTMTA